MHPQAILKWEPGIVDTGGNALIDHIPCITTIAIEVRKMRGDFSCFLDLPS